MHHGTCSFMNPPPEVVMLKEKKSGILNQMFSNAVELMSFILIQAAAALQSRVTLEKMNGTFYYRTRDAWNSLSHFTALPEFNNIQSKADSCGVACLLRGHCQSNLIRPRPHNPDKNKTFPPQLSWSIVKLSVMEVLQNNHSPAVVRNTHMQTHTLPPISICNHNSYLLKASFIN